MKNYLTEWKKFILEGSEQTKEAIKAFEDQLNAVKNQNQKEIEALNKQIQGLQVQAAAQEAQEKTGEIQPEAIPKTGTSNTISTTGTIPEASPSPMVFGMRAAGTVGNEPQAGGYPDRKNANGPNDLSMEEELTEEELDEACGEHKGIDENGRPCNVELQYEEIEEERQCNECRDCMMCGLLTEAKYKGRKVSLGKPMRGDVKKFKVFVRDPSTGNIKKVNFGDKKMRIKKSNPKRRKSFRARHRCANPGPRTKARYWSCRKW